MPVLIVGDVHGDIERLFAALKPYPADRWRTSFLGHLVDCGMFGVGCLRFARDRDNTEVLLGNHEVATLWALRDPARIGFWISVGGQRHDLDELRADEPLQEWLRARPALIRLPDRTLLQHCGNDQYLDLIPVDESDPVEAINGRTRDLLKTGGEDLLWNVLSGPNICATQSARRERWLEVTCLRCIIFGYTPQHSPAPVRYPCYHAFNHDYSLSRAH